jgi:hypothetical protein
LEPKAIFIFVIGRDHFSKVYLKLNQIFLDILNFWGKVFAIGKKSYGKLSAFFGTGKL